jgi:hypothetical protein
MSLLLFPFAFSEDETTQVVGRLELQEPLPYSKNQGGGFFRPGKITLEDGAGFEVVLYHNQRTASFIYLRDAPPDPNLLDIIGLVPEEIAHLDQLVLPGQLCMGSYRSILIGKAMRTIFEAPSFQSVFQGRKQQNMAVFPIAREGLKYQIPEAIFHNYGFYCDEVVLDAHHVFDVNVPLYNRKVEMTLFKDKDLDQEQKENITVAFIADSIASGLVMKEVIQQVKKRFPRLENIEVIAPLATIRGLCRIAESERSQDVKVRLHVFETLLNALPPDYYYSAHYNVPEFHIRPDLEADYRAWWGQDAQGNYIADTACAGYGWSEVFYSPRKQIEMMNDQLRSRHGLTITDILRRNLAAVQSRGENYAK